MTNIYKTPKHRTVIIGCGVVARKHMKAAWHNRDRIELTAIADINEQAMTSLINASHFDSKKDNIKFYQDYLLMLETERPDIVIITTPGGTHFDICMAALKSWANVLLEKPMTLIPEQAKLLNAQAEARGLKIALGHIYRYFPLVELIAKDIEAGKFGRPLYGDVSVFWGHDQAYYDSAAWRGTWKQDGGVIMNQTIHAIDLMSYFLGGRTSEVCSMLARQTHDMEAEDIGMAVIKRDNGTYCTVTGTTSSNPDEKEAAFDIVCTAGRIKAGIRSGKPYFDISVPRKNKSGTKNVNFLYVRRFMKETRRKYGLKWLLRIAAPHSWILRDLAESIETGIRPRADGISGEESVLTVSALYNAAKKRQTICLPLDSDLSGNIFQMDLLIQP